MTGTRYQVEISLYHKWNGTVTDRPPTTGTGVTLSGSSWDDELSSRDIAVSPRAWSDDLEELFPKDCTRSPGDGLAPLFRCVTQIQDLLGEVAEFMVVS